MKLSENRDLRKQLVALMEQLFPRIEELSTFLDLEFAKTLDSIAPSGKLPARILDIINDAETHGWLTSLLDKLAAELAQNAAAQVVLQHLRTWIDSATPPASDADPEDDPQSEPEAPGPAPPAPPPIERIESAANAIETALQTNKVVVLHGRSGDGKTEVADLLVSRQPDARRHIALPADRSAENAWAAALRASLPNAQAQPDIPELGTLFRAYADHCFRDPGVRFVLIVDDVAEMPPTTITKTAAELGIGLVLVSQKALTGAVAPVHLPAPTPEQFVELAMSFLASSARNAAKTKKALHDLATVGGCSPLLALAAAGVRGATPMRGLGELIERLRSAGNSHDIHVAGVAFAMEKLAQLVNESQAARDSWLVLAAMDVPEIPRAWLSEGATPYAQSLAMLESCGLVTADGDVRIHSVFRAHIDLDDRPRIAEQIETVLERWLDAPQIHAELKARTVRTYAFLNLYERLRQLRKSGPETHHAAITKLVVGLARNLSADPTQLLARLGDLGIDAATMTALGPGVWGEILDATKGETFSKFPAVKPVRAAARNALTEYVREKCGPLANEQALDGAALRDWCDALYHHAKGILEDDLRSAALFRVRTVARARMRTDEAPQWVMRVIKCDLLLIKMKALGEAELDDHLELITSPKWTEQLHPHLVVVSATRLLELRPSPPALQEAATRDALIQAGVAMAERDAVPAETALELAKAVATEGDLHQSEYLGQAADIVDAIFRKLPRPGFLHSRQLAKAAHVLYRSGIHRAEQENARRLAEAASIYTIVADDPDGARAQVRQRLMALMREAGRFDAALRVIPRCVSDSSDDSKRTPVYTALEIAKTYRYAQRYEEAHDAANDAIRAVQQTFEAGDDRTAFLLELARCAVHRKKWGEAKRALEQCLESAELNRWERWTKRYERWIREVETKRPGSDTDGLLSDEALARRRGDLLVADLGKPVDELAKRELFTGDAPPRRRSNKLIALLQNIGRPLRTMIMSPRWYVHPVLMAFIAMTMIGASYWNHIGDVDVVNGDRRYEAGYLFSLNWSLTYVLLIPAFMFAVVQFVNLTTTGIERLANRRMLLRSSDGRSTITAAVARTAWERRLDFAFGIAGIAMTITAFGTVLEFWGDTIAPILSERCSAHEIDWSVAYVCAADGEPAPGRWHNISFDLCAMSLQIVAGAWYWLGVAATLCASAYFLEVAMPQLPSRAQLVPDVKSDDPRRGFEAFQTPMLIMTLGSVVLGFAFLCVRLRDVYLHYSQTANTQAFIAEETHPVTGIIDAIRPGDDSTPWNPRDLFTLSGVEYSGGMAIAGAFLFAVVLVVFPLSTLSLAAHRACEAAKDRIREGKSLAEDMTLEAQGAALGSMQFWPIRWAHANVLLTLLGMTVLCVIFHRLALLLLTVALVGGVTRVVKWIRARLAAGAT